MAAQDRIGDHIDRQNADKVTLRPPAFTQMIFRIADSSVLPLAPMSPLLPLLLGCLQRYLKGTKLGTYYVLIMPYRCAWSLLLVVWYMLGLPIGPGVYPKME